MNTVGIFAGRGDTILAMGLALIVGIWIGHWLTKTYYRVKYRNAQTN